MQNITDDMFLIFPMTTLSKVHMACWRVCVGSSYTKPPLFFSSSCYISEPPTNHSYNIFKSKIKENTFFKSILVFQAILGDL